MFRVKRVRLRSFRVWTGLVGLAMLAACGLPSSRSAPTPYGPGPESLFPPVETLSREPETAANLTALVSSPYPVANRYRRFEQLSIEAGLSQSTVNCMVQDRYGYLWFGTEDGLNRYDGYNFLVFRPDPMDPGSLADRWITALYEDSLGNLWVATRSGGLHRYDRESGHFIRYQNDPGDPYSISSNQVRVIYQDNDGLLWVGTADGLNRFYYERELFERFYHEPDNPRSLTSSQILAILEDNAGNFWIGTEHGLNRMDRTSGRFNAYTSSQNISQSLLNDYVQAIFQDQQGNLWIGTQGGLERMDFEPYLFTHFRYNPINPYSLSNNDVLSIYQDSRGSLWIGTRNGLNRYNPDVNEFVRFSPSTGDPHSISSQTILSIYEDRGGVLWFGTFGAGVNKLDHSKMKFVHFKNQPGSVYSLSSNLVLQMTEDSQGTIWVATYGGGLNRFDKRTGRFNAYRHDPTNPKSLSSDEVWAVYEDRAGVLWVGTEAGLDVLDRERGEFTHFQHDPTKPASLGGQAVRVIAEDSQGSLWIGLKNGLDRYDRQSAAFLHFRHEPSNPASLSDNEITVLFDDHHGELWIGTQNGGLNRFDRESGTFSHYLHNGSDPFSLGSNSVSAIYQDTRGAYWVGTRGGGLNRFDPYTGRFQRFTEKDGLPNDVVNGVLQDKEGLLWVSTNSGLMKFNQNSGAFNVYDVSDGLQSNEFSRGSALLSKTGEMFFGGVNGLNVFEPSAVRDDPYTPPVVLTALTQGGEPLAPAEQTGLLSEVTLHWPRNFFEFEFAALSFGEPDKNQYAYILEGFDEEWIQMGGQRFGRYTNLPGKTFTLRLKGSNSDGVWNDTGIAIKIRVIPPFWETWWFRGVVLAGFAAGAVASYRLRLKRMEIHTRELRWQVSERTREIERRKQEIEALYQAGERMYRYLTIEQVLQALVDVAVDVLNADKSAVFTWNEGKEQLKPRVSRGFSASSMQRLSFTCGEGLVGKAAEREEALVVNNLIDMLWKGERRELVQTLLEEGIRSMMDVPIKAGGEVFGVFNVCFTKAEAFDVNVQRLFLALVQRASLTIENAQLFEQTKELAIVEERTRLARDLHDSAKQKAFAALAQMGAAGGMLKRDAAKAEAHVIEAENLVYEVIQELTFLIQEMYPAALKEKGLIRALRDYIFEWEGRNDIQVQLQVEGDCRLILETEQALYRIVQEALSNIARHSQAQTAEVSLCFNPETVSITINDNGQGFDVDRTASGLGLCSMKERASIIKGQLAISSAPGQGTRIEVTAPARCHANPAHPTA